MIKNAVDFIEGGELNSYYSYPVKPGAIAVFAYSLSVPDISNADPNTIELTISTTVPANTRFNAAQSSVNSAQWDCVDGSPAGTVCHLKRKQIDLFVSSYFAVMVDPSLKLPTTQITNTAEISINRPDPNPDNNRSIGSISIDYLRLDSYKSAVLSKDQNSNGLADSGDEISYLIEFTNTGQVDMMEGGQR